MNKERLEEIRKRLVLLHSAVDVDDETKNYIFKDLKVEWLIEQAERVQELEDIIYQDERQVVLEGMYSQNKRYRKALGEIINARNHFYPTEYVFGVEGIARQALEESE